MLNEKNIDQLVLNLQSGIDTFVYYIAHRVECREGFIDEYQYKSVPSFRVIKLKVKNIYNAYFEYLKYLEHPENYHTESEETFSDEFTKYVYYYTVPNSKSSYSLDLNPRIPSVIFGTRRILYKSGIIVGDYNDDTKLKPIYTNSLVFGGLTPAEVNERYENRKLDWKYKRLDNAVNIDGISYRYLTSNWFIIDIENFPRTEIPLINTKQKTAYFMTNEEAQSYLREIRA